MSNRQRVTVELELPDDGRAMLKLRWWLKRLARVDGWRCLSIRSEDENAPEPQDTDAGANQRKGL